MVYLHNSRLRRNYGRSAYPTQNYLNRAQTRFGLRHPQRGAHVAAATIGQAFRRTRMRPSRMRRAIGSHRRAARSPLLRAREGTMSRTRSNNRSNALSRLPDDMIRDVLSYI